jgi:hypothetical protein
MSRFENSIHAKAQSLATTQKVIAALRIMATLRETRIEPLPKIQ